MAETKDKLTKAIALLKGVRVMFGSDFFKVFRFVIAIIRLIVEIFGTDEDKEELNNGKSTAL